MHSFPFQNPDLPVAERVADWLARLTLEEKIERLGNHWPALERLGLPAFRWGGECLHGLCHTGRATVFPTPIMLAATFDPALVRRVAGAIADEARAKFHDPTWVQGPFSSLAFWTPNINLFRDPRWGRGQETYGEDPFLAGEMGLAFVRGLQGDDPRRLKAAACAKHYAVHSGPEALRTSFDAQVSPKVLHETYLPHFVRLVEGGVATVMATYNAVNGIPLCGHRHLLEEILRGRWGFQGFVVSDAGAITAMHRGQRAEQVTESDVQFGFLARQMAELAGHAYTADAPASAAAALANGCDMALGNDLAPEFVLPALEKGLVREADVDRALERIAGVGVRLGIFDPPPAARPARGTVQSPRHLRLAREAAARGAVLLKNNGVLPLGATTRVIAVSGPNAASAEVLLGNFYRGISGRLVTVVEGIAAGAPEGVSVTYLQGCGLNRPDLFKSTWALGMGDWADVTVAVVGNSPLMEGEHGECIGTTLGGDRDTMELPEVQLDYLRRLKAQTGKPLVLVVTTGSPILMPEAHDLADAVLLAWYPGEQGGAAVADILFGRVNPSGRLPVTFPRHAGQVPPFTDYSMRGRTYRFMDEYPLYPFGFGLSYTRFAYRAPELSTVRPRAEGGFYVAATITNVGGVTGEEVVQLYVANHADTSGPHRNLQAIRRVRLRPGESRRVRFRVTAPMLQMVNEAGEWVFNPGRFTFTVGPCSPGPRGPELGAPESVTTACEIATAGKSKRR